MAKKLSRGFIKGGLFGGAVSEAKPGLIILGVKRGGVKGVEEVIKKYIRMNFVIFRNALNPKRLKRFRGLPFEV